MPRQPPAGSVGRAARRVEHHDPDRGVPHGEGHFKAMAQEGEAPYISSALPLDDPFVALMAQTAAQPDSRIFITTPHTANLLLPTHAHLAKTLTACLGKLPAAKKARATAGFVTALS
ncbi:MAG: hypothetical protein R2857_13055 [Vampirovibrionales bacterium]